MWAWGGVLPSSTLLLIVGLFVYLAFFLIRFVRADASMSLLSREHSARGAFRGRVVWIVGASRGLGAALSVHFAKKGAKVILSSRSRSGLEAVAARARAVAQSSSDVLVLPMDVTSTPDELESAVSAAFDVAFGGRGVDYLVHNTGATQHARAEQASYETMERLVEINAMAAMRLARAATPRMLERGRGRHVVVASMAAVLPSPGQSSYAAAKSALAAYFLTLATETSSRGVGATVVYPGPIASAPSDPRGRTVYGPDGPTEEPRDPTKVPAGRISLARAVHLIAAAAAAELDEAWIARHPVLLLAYVRRHLPGLSMRILKALGHKRAGTVQRGGDGYSTRRMLFQRSNSSGVALNTLAGRDGERGRQAEDGREERVAAGNAAAGNARAAETAAAGNARAAETAGRASGTARAAAGSAASASAAPVSSSTGFASGSGEGASTLARGALSGRSDPEGATPPPRPPSSPSPTALGAPLSPSAALHRPSRLPPATMFGSTSSGQLFSMGASGERDLVERDDPHPAQRRPAFPSSAPGADGLRAAPRPSALSSLARASSSASAEDAPADPFVSRSLLSDPNAPPLPPLGEGAASSVSRSPASPAPASPDEAPLPAFAAGVGGGLMPDDDDDDDDDGGVGSESETLPHDQTETLRGVAHSILVGGVGGTLDGAAAAATAGAEARVPGTFADGLRKREGAAELAETVAA